jgi:adenosine kinase
VRSAAGGRACGAVGADFADYRRWLEVHHVDTRHVHVSETLHTARFLCTTDADNNQIASFYAGAMNEARHIDLAQILRAAGDVEIVLICPDDPAAMLRHTRACRDGGVPFAADPSQQIARMPGTDLRELVDGAKYLFTNEYERDLLIRKTGWSAGQLLDRVGAWVTTTGAKGVIIESPAGPSLSVGAAALGQAADPTGAGDAFRAGFLAGTGSRLGPERSAQMGCAMMRDSSARRLAAVSTTTPSRPEGSESRSARCTSRAQPGARCAARRHPRPSRERDTAARGGRR